VWDIRSLNVGKSDGCFHWDCGNATRIGITTEVGRHLIGSLALNSVINREECGRSRATAPQRVKRQCNVGSQSFTRSSISDRKGKNCALYLHCGLCQ
jgi:hypothetical protein